MKRYTVDQLARLAGTSVRTLHYYDEIGLLRPSFVGRNGYRYYEEKELVRLQQVLFFRELEFPLEDIKKMLERPDLDIIALLRDQKRLMQLKQKRINGLIKAIERTIMNMTNDTHMKDEEMYDAFKDDDVKQYQEEVKQRWGNTEAYRQSMAKVGKMTKKEMEKLKEEGRAFTQKLADGMDKGFSHPDVQALIAEHHKGINFFYECGLDTYRGLGQMYVDDARFTAYYDGFRPGLAVFMRDAIGHYCDAMKERA